MKKIAILTQPLYVNYGGILQNFALQYVLKSLGHQPITVNRVGKSPSKIRKVLKHFKNETYNRYRNKHRLIFSESEKIYITQNAQSFITKYINVSPNIETPAQLNAYFDKNNFDTIIVGSDQTWRPSISPDILNYFLNFLKDNQEINKISYAASFGVDFWEFDSHSTEEIKKLIKGFNAISVREKSGIALCQKYLDVTATYVCDPALLLHSQDYQVLFDKSSSIPTEGLYTYVLDKDKAKNEFIRNIERHLRLKAYKCQPEKDLFTEKSNNINDFVPPKIEHWIEGFYNADFVVTDSFHGTVFSILFNKPFITLINKERGASRFHSFLGYLNLENRLVADIDQFDMDLLSEKIDYNQINKKLDNFRDISLQFLKNNL